MRKELGKWLMDIAKYITTAVILTSIFGDVEQKWIIYLGGILAVAFTLGWGLYLVKDKRKENDMGALIMFTLVIVIANVGGFYFYFHDKKEQHKANNKV